ncbi:hypothetical protein EUGRSUZ_H00139 [Eucalyptus grandis]|uniref:Uncharacterized protein n=2 Tax=Eucalyptus grandis TaxID=71139 RepID=A0ACC3JLC6_EUCGR|nr:hypothetical protein EUGRSUZ_H00139 [Eucalyptus grandis]
MLNDLIGYLSGYLIKRVVIKIPISICRPCGRYTNIAIRILSGFSLHFNDNCRSSLRSHVLYLLSQLTFHCI